MEPSCVRQTSIPGTSALFGDYLYDYERVKAFYPHWFGDPNGLKAVAAAIDFPDSRRASLVEALREQNGDPPALQKLAQPGTVAVLTGQQVGLFSGPAYTIFKALTAVKLAEELSAAGTAAVPVFWLATEDHDLAEIDHAWVFTREIGPRKLEFTAASEAGGPVGDVVLGELPMDDLRHLLAGFPHSDAVLDVVQEAYRPGVTLGAAFRKLLELLLRDFGLLYVDPLAPAIREIAAPFLADAAQRVPELIPALKTRNDELEAAGYHTQVNIEADSSLLFLLENGKRLPLRWNGDEFVLKGDRRYRPADLIASGVTISPNAILRPVMQDYLFPTVAYVGGPAEIAYMAQAEVLYQRLLGRMPVIYPRNGFTLLNARATKLLQKYGLQVADLFDHHDQARGRVASKLVPPALTHEIAKVRSSIDSALQRLQEDLGKFDRTLEASMKKSTSKMLYQLDKIGRKTARETFLRDGRAAHDSDYLLNLIYPHRHLQERFYSIIPFLAENGLDLPARLWEHVQLRCPDHMIRTV